MRINFATSLALPSKLRGGRATRPAGASTLSPTVQGGTSVAPPDSSETSVKQVSLVVSDGARISPLPVSGKGAANDEPNADALHKIHALLGELRRLVAAGPEAGAEQATQPQAEDSLPESETETNDGTATSRVVSTTLIQGTNNLQVAAVTVSGLRAGQPWSVQGQVTRAAEAATLTVLGGDGATVAVGGTYSLSGSSGSITLELAAGEALDDVATRVNDHTSATGITAVVSSNNLTLTSTDRGHNASVALQPVGTPATTVTGASDEQVTVFTVNDFTAGASETVTGAVVSTAQAAELVYRGGPGGVAAGTATFRLTGSHGSASLEITAGESLAAVAQRVNDETAATGIVASLEGDDLFLSSDSVGAAAAIRVDEIEVAYDSAVSGVNSSQFADFSIVSLATGSQYVVSGQVLQSASRAALTLQGGAGGTVIDTATFEVRGSLGAATLSITEGESLAAVAQRVNDATSVTGATAVVNGNQLVFQSTAVGSAADVSVELIHVAHTTTVTGVNSQQLTAFVVDQFTEGASQTLSGSVTNAAGIAELQFQGLASRVGTTATFTLTGSVGSAQFSVTPTQTLNNLRNQVNTKTAITGVTAVVQSGKIKFRSVGTGTSATVDINVTSGSFAVTGGNGDGSANGTNAVAVVNGQTITGTSAGAGNQFQFSDAAGTYSFMVASGFTGALSPISIDSQAGNFDVTGGNGNGTANGLDALAEINGVALAGVGNRFVVGDADGQFELEFASGFTGQFDAVTASSTPHTFAIDGGDEAGTAHGADAVAVVNGANVTSADNRFAVSGEHGSYTIEFAAGFTGAIDPITVESLQIVGGAEYGRASGADAEAVIHGQQLVGSGSQFQFAENGRRATLTFVADFSGEFDAITATRSSRVKLTSRSSASVATGSDQTGTDNAVADERNSNGQFANLFNELETMLAAASYDSSDKSRAIQAKDPSRSATAGATRTMTMADIASQWRRAISQSGHFASLFESDPRLTNGQEQMRQVLDLLA